MSEPHGVTSILRLSFVEMMHIEAILSLAIDGATHKTRRFKIIESAHKKILDVLEQADRDGSFDVGAAARELGLEK